MVPHVLIHPIHSYTLNKLLHTQYTLTIIRVPLIHHGRYDGSTKWNPETGHWVGAAHRLENCRLQGRGAKAAPSPGKCLPRFGELCVRAEMRCMRDCSPLVLSSSSLTRSRPYWRIAFTNEQKKQAQWRHWSTDVCSSRGSSSSLARSTCSRLRRLRRFLTRQPNSQGRNSPLSTTQICLRAKIQSICAGCGRSSRQRVKLL